MLERSRPLVARYDRDRVERLHQVLNRPRRPADASFGGRLSQPAGQKTSFAVCGRQAQCFAVVPGGLLRTVQSAQEIGTHGRKQVVTRAGSPSQRVIRRWSAPPPDRGPWPPRQPCSVRSRVREQRWQDGRTARRSDSNRWRRLGRRCVTSDNGGLNLVGPGTRLFHRVTQNHGCFGDLVGVPAGAVLLLERDQVAQLVQTGVAPSVVHQHAAPAGRPLRIPRASGHFSRRASRTASTIRSFRTRRAPLVAE